MLHACFQLIIVCDRNDVSRHDAPTLPFLVDDRPTPFHIRKETTNIRVLIKAGTAAGISEWMLDRNLDRYYC